MSSLACKCVIYKPEHIVKGGDPMELNFEVLEMQKLNKPTGSAQKVR